MKRLISLTVSLLILAFIYWKIDFQALLQVFRDCDRLWMAVSLSMVIPLTMLTGWRLQQLTPSMANLGFAEANRLILAASSLNMILPSKMGDIAKAYFLRKKGNLSGSKSLSLVVLEKACDMSSLLLWCAFGLTLYPRKDWLFGVMTLSVASGLAFCTLLLASEKFAQLFFSLAGKVAPGQMRSKLATLQTAWEEMHGYFWRDRGQLALISVTSIVLWFGHLLQIWFFILALNAWTPFWANLALSPLAILAGLLPLTFAGVGTRDAALILFYQPYFPASTAAALGVLCTSRYLIPAIGGLPFLEKYMTGLPRQDSPDRDRPIGPG